MEFIIAFLAGLLSVGSTTATTPDGRHVNKITTPVQLVSNFSEKKSTKQIVEEGNCSAGINGGFYTEENRPLGWYYLDYQRQRPVQSQMLNGFVSDLGIFRDVPKDPKWGFQSGPVLIENSRPLSLEIVNDRPARRSVLGISASGEFTFVAVDPVNLANLPKKIEDLGFVTAINLDGGSAAAFYSPSLSLPEIEPVGSFLCAKN